MIIPRVNIRTGGVFPFKSFTRASLKLSGYLGIQTVRNLLYAITGISALTLTTSGNRVVNKAAQLPLPLVNFLPVADHRPPTEQNLNGIRCDNFIYQYPDFKEKIIDLLQENGVDLKTLDLNKDGIILNTNREVQELYNSIMCLFHSNPEDAKVLTAFDTLKEADTLNQVMWGTEPIKPGNLRQGWNNPTCQHMGVLLSTYFNEEQMQDMKGRIEITSYNLDKNNFHINSKVHIDGEIIEIPFSPIHKADPEQISLTEWISPRGFGQSSTLDTINGHEVIGPAIFLCAAQQILAKKYDTVPNVLPAASATIMTGKQYNSVLTLTLQKEQIKNVLKHVPKSPVTVASMITKSDFMESLKVRATRAEDSEYSSEKGNTFTREATQRVQKIILTNEHTRPEKPKPPKPEIIQTPSNNKNIPNDIPKISFSHPPSNVTVDPNQGTSTKNGGLSDPRSILSGHVYAVEKFNEENDSVTVIDAHGTRLTFTTDVFIENFPVITANVNHLPAGNPTDIPIYLAALTIFAGTFLGANKLNRLMYPNYKSLGQRACSLTTWTAKQGWYLLSEKQPRTNKVL